MSNLNDFRRVLNYDRFRYGDDDEYAISVEARAAELANSIVSPPWSANSARRKVRFFEMFGIGLILCPWYAVIAPGRDAVSVDGELVSREAFDDEGFHCEHCTNAFHTDRSTRMYDDGAICDGCAHLHYEWSDQAEAWYRPGERPEDEEQEEEEDDEDYDTDAPAHTIRDYSYDVMRSGLKTFQVSATEPDLVSPLWMGVELEVYPRGGRSTEMCAQASVSAMSGFVVLKSDGSIPGNGFEIVTVPATLARHREAWMPFFDKAAPYLRSWYGGQCGMHVHYSRDAILPATLGKMTYFVNASQNMGFITKLAGRESTSYSKLSPKKLSRGLINKMETRSFDEDGRYAALNNQNDDTVELRIFRGNVAMAGFMKNLDFAHALWAFCDQASSARCLAADFLVWLDRRSVRMDYPFLIRWAEGHHLIPRRIKEPSRHQKAPVVPLLVFEEAA